jgi:MoxR-like ATPase
MQERIVTVASTTKPLPEPFILIATQNPIETEGTYRLPIAQRDRFQFKLQVSLPDRDDERELFDRFNAEPDLTPESVTPVISADVIRHAKEAVDQVYVDDKVREYVLDIVEASREHPMVDHGASPRATLAFLRAGKAKAAIRGRDYVIPSDIRELAQQVLAHRLVLDADADFSGQSARDIVDEIIKATDAPGANIGADEAFEAGEAAVSDGGGSQSDERSFDGGFESTIEDDPETNGH